MKKLVRIILQWLQPSVKEVKILKEEKDRQHKWLQGYYS